MSFFFEQDHTVTPHKSFYSAQKLETWLTKSETNKEIKLKQSQTPLASTGSLVCHQEYTGPILDIECVGAFLGQIFIQKGILFVCIS